MALREILSRLCSKTGWCYAVFWKLKRQSRMVLTWEDGHYEHHPSTNFGVQGGNDFLGTIGNNQGSQLEAGCSEGQIEHAMAKMSYCVYFMGEGIIGRVAFTGKHQWVFGDGENNITRATPGGVYPAGWQAQFDAGIKTIAVIAVPQGVLQLGSTQMIMEDMEWVNHVKSAFAALQGVPGAFLSDLLSEGQGGVKRATNTSRISSTIAGKSTSGQPRQAIASNNNDAHGPVLQSGTMGTEARLGSVKGPSRVPGFLPTVETTGETLKSMSKPSDLQQVLGMTEAGGWRPGTLPSAPYISESFSGMSSLTNESFPLWGDHSSSYIDETETETQNNSLKGQDQPLKGHDQPLKGHNQPSSVGFTGNIWAGLDGGIPSEVICNQEDPGSNTVSSLNKVLDLKNEEGLFRLPTNSNHQLQATPSALTSFAHAKVNGTIPFLHQTSSAVPDLTSSRLTHHDAGVDNIYNLPLVECHTTEEGIAESICTSNLHSNLCECTPTGQDSLCSITGLNVWDRQNVDVAVSNCMPQSTPVEVKLDCNNLEATSGRFGTKSPASRGLMGFDKYLDSVVREQSGMWDCSFPIGDELSQALGPAFRGRQDKDLWDEMLPHSGGNQASHQVSERTCGIPEHVPSKWDSNFLKDSVPLADVKSEALLDAVVGNASSSFQSITTNTDDCYSSKTTFSLLDSEFPVLNGPKEADSEHVRCYTSHNSLAHCRGQTVPEGVPVGIQNVNRAGDHLNFHASTTDSSFRTILSAFSDDMQTMKSNSTHASQSRKPEEPTKTSRKRARPGESTRPRPKDRQQIQDRVRELREIVPNGSKCSIDALLEKTIKHMLFLQNVTLHADKLRKSGELKDDVESGASWALEVGGDELGCPILVKNLSQPRQLLVEMFCEERGHFLEIADGIRNLGLTILKGVMESRTDKIWARFVVEANKDVHRVDIMISLMQLLHVNNSGSSSSMTMASQSGPMRSSQ